MNFNPETVNLLSEQFLDYQLLNDHDIPNSVWQSACTMDDDRNKYSRVDILWGCISQMKDCIGKHRFDILFKVLNYYWDFHILMHQKKECLTLFVKIKQHFELVWDSTL